MMKIRLLRAARINHKPGETVEASPEQARFLISIGAAEIVKPAEKKKPAKK